MASPVQLEQNSYFLSSLSIRSPPPLCPLFSPLSTLHALFWPPWISLLLDCSVLLLVSGPLQPLLPLEYSSEDLYHCQLLLVTCLEAPHTSPPALFTLRSVALFSFPHIISHYLKIPQLFILLLICCLFSLEGKLHESRESCHVWSLLFFLCPEKLNTFGKGVLQLMNKYRSG